MLTSPQSLTVNSVATDLHRTEQGKTSSIYQSVDGNIKLTVSHQVAKSRTRRMMRVDLRVVAADPLSSVNTYQNAACYIVIDEPAFGFTDATLTDLATALKTWASSANIGAVLASRH